MLPTWGASSERYEQLSVAWARRAQQPEIVSPVLPYVPRDQRVLDLGCSTGTLARSLFERGCKVVGVEVDPAAAAHATAWCERVIVADLDLIDLAEALVGHRFDVVVAGDVLEHLRDPARLLAALPPLLAPGGRVIACVPNIAHGSVRLALLAGEFAYEDAGILDKTHLRFFTATSARRLFEATGFAVQKFERIVVPLDEAVPFDRSALPAGVEEAVAAMPDATTFQFVLVCEPTATARAAPSPATPTSPQSDEGMLSAQAEALRVKDRSIAELRAELAGAERQLRHVRGSRLWRAREAIRRLMTSQRNSDR